MWVLRAPTHNSAVQNLCITLTPPKLNYFHICELNQLWLKRVFSIQGWENKNNCFWSKDVKPEDTKEIYLLKKIHV